MLAGSLRVQSFMHGDTVFSQGDIGTDFYIVRRGLVEFRHGGRVLRTIGQMDYFGERAFLNNEPRSATCVAVYDTECWLLDNKTLQGVMQDQMLKYLRERMQLQDTSVTLEQLRCIRVVGRGGFGVVKMVQSRSTNVRYALKCVPKKNIVEQGLQKSIVAERALLAELDHPFIIKFVKTFRTASYIYFLTELCTGGELFDALDNLGCLNQSQAQFYIGSIILAMEFLHARQIGYFDLKSENCLLDSQGHLKLIDFGAAHRLVGQSHKMIGTPGFMAPEVILGKGYTTSADLWTIGICLYEFVFGKLPFGIDFSKGQADCFKRTLSAELQFPEQVASPETRDLIRLLLQRAPAERLGAGFEGYVALKEHKFFSSMSWEDLLGRRIEPPYVPVGEIYSEAAPKKLGASEFPVEEKETGWIDPNPGWDVDF